MLIFIDESGTHKNQDHSTIVLVYVCIENIADLENKIQKIEQNLEIRYFHWSNFGSKAGWRIRKEFIKRIAKLKFTFKIALINNPVYLSKELEHCLQYLIIEKKIKKIILDGKKPKWYERRIKKILREKGVSIKKLRTLNDQSSPGLRLADALAGLVRHYYDKPTDTVKNLYQLLTNKITAQLVDGQKTR